jgi:hypothetical protein
MAYTNVNDHLYLGKSAEEIARMHAEFQGIPYSQAINDPSIRLFTDPEYREMVTTPLPVSTMNQADIKWINPDTGSQEHIVRATGYISRSDAEALASRLGGSVVVAPRAFGASFDDYDIVMPSGYKVNASEIAAAVNQAQTPEQAYSYFTQLQQMTSGSSPAVKATIESQRQLDQLRSRPAAILKTATSANTTAPLGSSSAPGSPIPIATGISNSTAQTLGWSQMLKNIFTGQTADDTALMPSSAGDGTVAVTGSDSGLLDNPLVLVGLAGLALYFITRK